MDRAPHLAAEDDDPLFTQLNFHLRSRRRTREVIAELKRQGYVLVSENELRALRGAAGKPVDTAAAAGLTEAILAASRNF